MTVNCWFQAMEYLVILLIKVARTCQIQLAIYKRGMFWFYFFPCLVTLNGHKTQINVDNNKKTETKDSSKHHLLNFNKGFINLR